MISSIGALKQSVAIQTLANSILNRNRRALAKAITLVESTRSEDMHHAQELITLLLPHTGASRRIGITGVPGVGKSTFIEALGLMLIAEGHNVAVLAVDPSSERTGGSILGDKTRMMHLARAPEAFIRPSPAGKALGGVARRTRESMLLCEAAGFDVVLVETVGVGQSETAVASMTDFFLMLMLAGAGDELQGIKRGIMELTDAVAVNKAEDHNRKAAELAAQQMKNALHLATPKYADWSVPVMLCSALENKGLQEIWQAIHTFFAENPERVRTLRQTQAVRWMNDTVHDGLRQMLTERKELEDLHRALEHEVFQQLRTPTAAAVRLLEEFRRVISAS